MTPNNDNSQSPLRLSPFMIAITVFMLANAFSRMVSDDLAVSLTITFVAAVAAYVIANSTISKTTDSAVFTDDQPTR